MTGNILRVGIDAAGGLITSSPVNSVTINGVAVVVPGSPVASHGLSPHNAATMVGHSSSVTAGGLGVCRLGDAATCGHTGTPGSPTVTAGG